MDDIAEQQDVAKEISDAISNPVAFGQVISCLQFWLRQIRFCFQEFDEDELEAELDALGEELELEEQEELDKALLDVGPAVGLPEVPTAEPNKPAPSRVMFFPL